MKNLPEKIYLNLNMTPQEVVETKDKDFHEATKTWEITWSEECLSEHDPEYVRKDAFIKRVINFLNYKLFSELNVSEDEDEDEKIRKSIIAIINNYVDNSNTFKPKMIAWLEKQGKIVAYYEDRLDECSCKYFNKGYKHALENQGGPKEINID